jgi:hypothetical protein
LVSAVLSLVNADASSPNIDPTDIAGIRAIAPGSGDMGARATGRACGHYRAIFLIWSLARGSSCSADVPHALAWRTLLVPIVATRECRQAMPVVTSRSPCRRAGFAVAARGGHASPEQSSRADNPGGTGTSPIHAEAAVTPFGKSASQPRAHWFATA